jgi:hypothetical protein
MFRFTIRDVLWLTVVVALIVGWGLSYRQWRSDREEMGMQRNALSIDNDNLRSSHAHMVYMYERDTGQKLSFPLLSPTKVEPRE